jgi:hypothetical protein
MKYNNGVTINKTDIKMYFYLIIAFLFLITFGIRAIKGDIDFEFYADSETYIEFVNEKQSFSNIILLNPNMLGPTLILKLFNNSFISVFFLNVIIVLFFYFTFSKKYNIDRRYLFLYFLLSSIFFSSVISINKEIISLLSIAFFFRYYKTNSFSMLLLSIFISLLVRWQMTLFIVSLVFMLSTWNPLRKYKLVLLSLFLLTISIVYYINIASFESFNLIAELGQESSVEGSGLFNIVLNLQNSGLFGYFLAFIPKFLFLFIGVLARYYKLLDTTDFYNNVVVFLQSIANLMVLIKIIKLKIGLDNIFLFSAIVYCIIFALSPIFAPRYFFPAYILLSLAVASHCRILPQ